MLFAAALTAIVTLLYHNSQRVSVKMPDVWQEEGKWIALANILEAETLTGHGIPSWPSLCDVVSYESIHELYFIDWKSRESITIWFSESQPYLTAEQMKTVRDRVVEKRITQQIRQSTAPIAVGLMLPRVLGVKRLKLLYGEVIKADEILVPLRNGGSEKGLQVQLLMDGKLYHVLSFGRAVSERRFAEFLNAWRGASLIPRQSIWRTPHEKSIAYATRGKFLAQIALRRSEAVEYLQKAIQFDPKNSEARLQLQSLTTAMGHARDAERINH